MLPLPRLRLGLRSRLLLVALALALAAGAAASPARPEEPPFAPTPAPPQVSSIPEASNNVTSTENGDVSSSTLASNSTTEAAATTAPPAVEGSTSEAIMTAMNASSESPSMAENNNDGNLTMATRNNSGRSFDFDSNATNSTVEKGSLQDLNLDDIDMSMFMTTEAANETGPSMDGAPFSSTAASASASAPGAMCVEANGSAFAPGQRFNRSCDEACVCMGDGRAACAPRCTGPLFRRGSRAMDADCFERQAPSDPCCAVMVCAEDTETEPVEECQYKNKTYQRGDIIKDGCENVCACGEAGAVSCKPRCAPVNGTASDRCVALPDPADPCCSVLRCDVTLNEHDAAADAGSEEAAASTPSAPAVHIAAVEELNATAVRLDVMGELPAVAVVEVSYGGGPWKEVRRHGLVVLGLEPGRAMQLRVTTGGVSSNTINVELSGKADKQHEKGEGAGCVFKGQNHTLNDQFLDGCKALCQCTEEGVQCTDLECPTDLGLEVLDPHCLRWEVVPAGFEPVPPHCCPDEVRCANNGTCEYGGEAFANYAPIPARLTGCERRCYCDAGNVTCQPACPPMPAAPPADLACAPHEARLDHVPGDDCCLYWTCPGAQHPDAHGDTSEGQDATPTESSRPNNESKEDNGQTFSGPFVLNPDRASNNVSSHVPEKQTEMPTMAAPLPTTSMDESPMNESSMEEGSVTPIPDSDVPQTSEVRPIKEVILTSKPAKPGKKNAIATDTKGKDDGGKDKRPFDARPTISTMPHMSEMEEMPEMHDEDMHEMHQMDVENTPFPGPLSPQHLPPGPHHHEIPEHVLHELHQQGLFPGQARPPPPPPGVGRPPQRPPGPPGPPEDQEIYLHHLLPPQVRPGPHRPPQTAEEEQELIHHLQQQGLLPSGNPQRPQGRPGASPNDQDILIHLQQQGLLPQHRPGQSRPIPGRGPGHQPDADEQEILLHLQQQGLIPPGTAGPPPPRRPQDGRHPNFPRPQGHPQHPNNEHDDERDLYLHLQQQGLIPQHPQIKPGQKPPRPPPDQEQEILLHLQQQGLVPQKPGTGRPPPPRPAPNQDNILVHIHPQGSAPQPGKAAAPGKKPDGPTHPHEDDDVLAHFQQGLLPFQQGGGPPPHGQGQRPGTRHPPLTEEELIFQLQQQGLLPPGASLPGAHPHPPLLLPPPPPPGVPRNRSHAEYPVTSVPGGFGHLPTSGQPEDVVVQTLEARDPTSVRVVFVVPPVFVGLHGRIELRYTDDKNNADPSTWQLQVLAPPQDLLATSTLEFTLGDLRPDTEYRVKITVLLRDLQNTPSSPIVAVRTPPMTSTPPPVVPVAPELAPAEINTTWAVISWRRFTETEMQLIDGVQLRYKQLDDKVYAATPLIHRAVTSYTLEGLQPATTYEVGIFFIPFPGQASELQADAPIHITTKEATDQYKFDIHVDVHHIKATSVEVNWTGVPYPEDRYVNIYRAIYQSESGKEDFSTFTVAKRDSISSTLIKDLLPGTRYRLWLEVYLTNGKIKKSNVQDFSTRPGSVANVGSSQQGKLESSASPVKEAADYYSPLVAVSILAALAIMATLILLLMLMKRRGQTKAAISAGRKSQSAYDNPSYKTCDDPQPPHQQQQQAQQQAVTANSNGSAAKAPTATAEPA